MSRVSRPRLAALALALASAAVPRAAAAVVGYPGSAWGALSWDLPGGGVRDLILEGWVRQGVAWWRAPLGAAGLVLQTYATVRYRWDRRGLDWNNHVSPGAGVAIDVTMPRMPALTAGAEWVDEWRFRSGTTSPTAAPFVDWYHAWDLRTGAFPGSTWGDVRWEIPWNARENLVAEGWVRQGVVLQRWRREPLTLVLSPYLRVRGKGDTLGHPWNNFLGPGLGLSLDLDGVRGFQPGLAVEYAWEKELASAGSVHRVDVLLRWYGFWDLARR